MVLSQREYESFIQPDVPSLVFLWLQNQWRDTVRT